MLAANVWSCARRAAGISPRAVAAFGASLLAICAVAVGASSAAAAPSVLTLSTAKGDLKPGAELRAASSDLLFVTSAGDIECSSSVLTGTLATNSAAKDTGQITAEQSSGGEAGGLCKTTTPLGPASVQSDRLPWQAEFTAKGANLVRGKKVTFTLGFPAASETTCVYESSGVHSMFKTGQNPAPLTLTTTSQVFKLNKPVSNAACPGEGHLSGHFTVTSGEEAVQSRSSKSTKKTKEPPEPCPEEAQLDSEGRPILPAGAEVEGEETVDEEPEPDLSTQFPSPQFNTTMDTWYAKEPCNPSLGGEVPQEAQEGKFEVEEGEESVQERLESLAINATAKEVQAALGEIAGKVSQGVTELSPGRGSQLPAICRTKAEPKAPPCEYSSAGAPDLDATKPFGGRDIIFVHGFEQKPFTELPRPEWPSEPSEFYGGYWKGLANEYWANHIQRWLHGQYPGSPLYGQRVGKATNRYMTVAWAPTQRLFIGAHAMLSQISTAMTTGEGVVNDADPTAAGKEGFCGHGCVIISHSTGGPLTDVAMRFAEKTASGGFRNKYGNLTFIPEHIRAHIALHGAFAGSGIATLAVAFSEHAMGQIANLCRIGETIINAVISPFNGNVSGCGAIPTLEKTIETSSLVDLMPPVMQTLWGPWIKASPIPTVTVAGGHPTADGIDNGTLTSTLARPIIKLLALPGLDDGVLAMNSQCANPDKTYPWPSGYQPRPSFLDRFVFDMGVSTRRAVGFYVGQLIDPAISGAAVEVGAGCSPYVSPDGMVQPVKAVQTTTSSGHGTSPLDRYAKHYSFLQSVSDHYVGPLNSSEPGIAPFTPECYLATSPDKDISPPDNRCFGTGHNDNSEESRVVTKEQVYWVPARCGQPKGECLDYQPPANCANNASPECARLLSPLVGNLVYRVRSGRNFKYRLFGKKHVVWFWERKYDRVAGWKQMSETDYVYDYVLRP